MALDELEQINKKSISAEHVAVIIIGEIGRKHRVLDKRGSEGGKKLL